jgi:flagellar operon protein
MSVAQGMKINNYQRPMNLIEIAGRTGQANSRTEVGSSSFKEMFSKELATEREVSFSRHAHERLFSRGIELDEAKLNKLADAIDKAESKASKETLILDDEAAYVVSVSNRTVVTVFDRDNLQDGIVTSIDSAVIM